MKLQAVDTSQTSPNVRHLVHVVCLPMQLKRKTALGEDLPIQSIKDALNGICAQDHWQELPAGDTPWAMDGVASQQAWQARVYFHPFVRRFLYDPDRVRWLQRHDIKKMAIEILPGKTVTLAVSRCLMALFQPDIACLLLELDYAASADEPPLDLSELQRLLDRVRRTYPPYFATDEKKVDRLFGGHCPETVTWLDGSNKPIGLPGRYGPSEYQSILECACQSGSWKPAWAAHWKTLLAPLYTDHTPNDGQSIGIRQFGDDRAAILSYIAFDNVQALNRGQWVRLCFADGHGSDPLPYAERFLNDFEAQHAYDRYWYTGEIGNQVADSSDLPSRILNCGYAFTYAGSQGCQHFFANADNGALFTFRHIYVFMGLIVHMQRAALLAASHRLTDLVQRDGNKVCLPDRDEVRRFFDQFVEFTQTYWFDEITPQEQGQQIFAQWQRHLRIQPLYDEVRQELHDLAEYSELLASNSLNTWVARLGSASLVLAALAVLSGLLGMNILKVEPTPVTLIDGWTTLLWGDGQSWQFALPFAVAALSGLLAVLALVYSFMPNSWLRRFKRRREH